MVRRFRNETYKKERDEFVKKHCGITYKSGRYVDRWGNKLKEGYLDRIYAMGFRA